MSSTLPNGEVTPTTTEGSEFASTPPPDARDTLEGDERMYTGEPVDDGDRVRRPQQMNVGVENMEGGGEWPDPKAPPAPEAPGDDDRRERGLRARANFKEGVMTGKGELASDDLVAAVQQVHEQIKSLLNDVLRGGPGKRDAFATLAATAAAHETAEQTVVHPLTRQAEGGEAIAAERVSEEHEGKQALERLKRLGVDDPQFDALFGTFRAAVLQHATNEEMKEHPILERTLSAEASRKAADEFRAAQSVDA
jgi:hypothetical protein